jgi:hypothetical protein
MGFDGTLFKGGRIVESVQYCTAGIHSRFCPFCEAPPSAGCACQIPGYQAAHPLDFSRHVEALQRYTGEYVGSVNAVIAMPNFAAGSMSKKYLSSLLVSSMRVTGYARGDSRHDELADLFQSFAVQLSLSDRSPARAFLPRPASPPGNSTLLESAGFQVETGQGELTVGVGACGIELPRDNVTKISYRNLAPVAGPGQARPLPDTHTKPDGISMLSDGSEQRGCNSGAVTAFGDQLALLHGCTSGNDQTDGDGQPPDAQQLRRLGQRMRNRAAAARSNARRKERNEVLRIGLERANQQVCELRKWETALRAENLSLRRRLRSPPQQAKGRCSSGG